MKKILTEQALIRHFLSSLGERGDDYTLEVKDSSDQQYDAAVTLHLDGKKTDFIVEAKLNPATETVERFAKASHSKPALLLLPHLPDRLAALCRRRKICHADLNGRLYLRADGIFIDQRPQEIRFKSAVAKPDPFAPKSSRLIRTLLAKPLISRSQSQLCEETRISRALASRLLNYLREEQFIEETPSLFENSDETAYRVSNFDGLLDAWKASDDWQKRVSIHQLSVLENDPFKIARAMQGISDDKNVVFTQWFAAWLRRPHTTPPIISAYVRELTFEYHLQSLISRPVDSGGQVWLIIPQDEGVFLEHQEVEGFRLACDVQIYLDLLQVQQRGPEAAEELRKAADFSGRQLKNETTAFSSK